MATTLVAEALAAQFDLALLAVGGVPLGDFGRKTDIVEPQPDRTYAALGGGARNGFGMNLEMEAEVRPAVFVGGRLGYLRNSADASEIQRKGLMPGLEEINAAWGIIYASLFTRMVAYDSRAFDMYVRAGLGIASVKNYFDATYHLPWFGRGRAASSFDLGNHFFMSGGIGSEYRISRSVSLVTEFSLTHLFTNGAEATASYGGFSLTGTQKFDIQALEIMTGMRISFGGR